MKKRSLNFFVDITLLGLFLINVLSAPLQHVHGGNLHPVSGMILASAALFHLGTHWEWIKNILLRFDKLPANVRVNAGIDLLLFCGYMICALTGMSAWLAEHAFAYRHIHAMFALLHFSNGLFLVAIQTVHLSRHWKWIWQMMTSQLSFQR
jgi:hypothetical protein